LARQGRVVGRLEVVGHLRIGLAIRVGGRIVPSVDLDVDAPERLAGVGDGRAEVRGRLDGHRASRVGQLDVPIADAFRSRKVGEVTEKIVERSVLEHHDDPVVDLL
jgi:hypothetical protein